MDKRIKTKKGDLYPESPNIESWKQYVLSNVKQPVKSEFGGINSYSIVS